MKLLTRPTRIRVIPRAVVDAAEEARALRSRARAQAEALVEQAHADAADLRDSARAEGLAQAHAEANAMVVQAAIAAEAWRGTQQDTIARLAVDVARTVLTRDAETGPDVLRDIARAALARFRRARRLLLRVHPLDLDAARDRVRGWLADGCEPDVLAVEPDAECPAGWGDRRE